MTDPRDIRRPEDLGEVLFSILSAAKPEADGWVLMNDKLNSAGITLIHEYSLGAHFLDKAKHWADAKPLAHEVYGAHSLVPLTNWVDPLRLRLTDAGRSELKRRDEHGVATELARKQNEHFERSMGWTRRSLYLSGFALLVTTGALCFNVYREQKSRAAGQATTQALLDLLREHAKAHEREERATAHHEDQPIADSATISVQVLCGPCKK